MEALTILVKNNEHEIESVFIPGLFLTTVGFFIQFYPNFLTWNYSLINSTILITVIIGLIFVTGVFIHKLGKLIEKFIEKIFKFDLKRINKISWIISKKKAENLIRKYKLVANNSDSEEKWKETIKSFKKKLKGNDKKLQLKYNRHNKLSRGLLTDTLVLFIYSWVKFGFYFIWNNWIIFFIIILIIICTVGMFDFEKREMEIIYSKV